VIRIRCGSLELSLREKNRISRSLRHAASFFSVSLIPPPRAVRYAPSATDVVGYRALPDPRVRAIVNLPSRRRGCAGEERASAEIFNPTRVRAGLNFNLYAAPRVTLFAIMRRLSIRSVPVSVPLFRASGSGALNIRGMIERSRNARHAS